MPREAPVPQEPHDERTAEQTHQPIRARMIHAFITYMDFLGGLTTAARIPGFRPPQLLEGSVVNQRPDYVGRWDHDGAVVIAEAVVRFDTLDEERKNRFTLLASAAAIYNTQVVYLVRDHATAARLRAALDVGIIHFTTIRIMEIL